MTPKAVPGGKNLHAMSSYKQLGSNGFNVYQLLNDYSFMFASQMLNS